VNEIVQAFLYFAVNYFAVNNLEL